MWLLLFSRAGGSEVWVTSDVKMETAKLTKCCFIYRCCSYCRGPLCYCYYPISSHLLIRAANQIPVQDGGGWGAGRGAVPSHRAGRIGEDSLLTATQPVCSTAALQCWHWSVFPPGSCCSPFPSPCNHVCGVGVILSHDSLCDVCLCPTGDIPCDPGFRWTVRGPDGRGSGCQCGCWISRSDTGCHPGTFAQKDVAVRCRLVLCYCLTCSWTLNIAFLQIHFHNHNGFFFLI